MNVSARNRAGLYVGFTGLDGAGKSTQAAKLAQYLRSLGRQCYVCEPKDDLVAQASIAIASRAGVTQREYFGAFAFELAKAFSAVRHHYSVVAPLLKAGVDIIDPRTNNCRIALAAAQGCEAIEKLQSVYDLVDSHDLLLHLVVSPELAFQRVLQRDTDQEDLEDLRRFAKTLRSVTPDAAALIDGEREEGLVEQSIRCALAPFL